MDYRVRQRGALRLGERDEFIGRDQVLELEAAKVAPLVVSAEVVDQDKVGAPPGVEGGHGVAPDEAGRAGDDDRAAHGCAGLEP